MQTVELKYHKSIKQFYYLIIGICILIELFIIRLKFSSSFEDGAILGIFYLLLASTIPLSILIRAFLVVRPRIFSVIEVYENFFLILFKSKKRKFAFNQIHKIERSLLPMRFLGGFVIVFENGQKIRISSAQENHLHFLEQIRNYKQGLVSDKFLIKYQNDSKIVEHSWRRFVNKWKQWYFVILKYLCIPFLTSYTFLRHIENAETTKSAKILLLCTVVILGVFSIALVCNSIEENMINLAYKKQLKTNKNIQANLKMETGLHTASNLLFLFLVGFLSFSPQFWVR